MTLNGTTPINEDATELFGEKHSHLSVVESKVKEFTEKFQGMKLTRIKEKLKAYEKTPKSVTPGTRSDIHQFLENYNELLQSIRTQEDHSVFLPHTHKIIHHLNQHILPADKNISLKDAPITAPDDNELKESGFVMHFAMDKI